MTNNFNTATCQFFMDARKYTYKTPVGWDVKVGDTAVVKTRDGYKLVNVIEVTDGDKAVLNPNINYQFIVQIVSDAEYNLHMGIA